MNGSKIPVIRSIVALGSVSGAVTIDASKGNYQTMTLTGNATLTVSNVQPGDPLYLQVTRSAVAAVVTWAGQAAGLLQQFDALSTGVLVLTGSSQTLASLTISSFVPSASITPAGGDEVIWSSNGLDDTSNLNAIMTAGLVARAVPSGGVFYVNGSTMSVQTGQTGSGSAGGIVGDGEGVEIRPTTGWTPAIGLVDDSTNCFLRIEGQDQTSGYTGSIAATVQVRGGFALTGIGTTTGAAAGQVLEVKASPTGGSVVPQQRCMVKVASVSSGTALTTNNALRLMFGDGYNTLPATLTAIVPINKFRLQNLYFNTLGKNIAGIANFVRCFATATGTSDVTATPLPSILIDNVRGAGFTKAMFSESCCDGITYQNCFSGGSNNGCWYGTNTHAWTHTGWKSTSTGPAFNAVGTPKPGFWSWGAGSDGRISDCDLQNMAGFSHIVGGWANKFDNNSMEAPQADIRFTRDATYTVNYCGAMYCMSLTAGTNADARSVEYNFGTATLREAYTNSTTFPVTSTAGVWGFVFVDTFGMTYDTLNITNLGNGADALNGTMYAPVGGVYKFDCFYGGTGAQINARNVQGAAMCARQAGWNGRVAQIRHNKRAGKSTGTASPTAIMFATAGNRGIPRIGTVIQEDGGNFADFDATWVASPDYEFRCEEYINYGASTYFRDIMFGLNSVPTTFAMTDVAILDPASPAATRRILLAGADGVAPCIIVQGTNSTQAFIAVGGGSVNTTGAVQPGDLLTTEGGANHRAKVQPAATLATVIGRALVAQAATGIINARAF